jgi:uncharacterized protein YkwD
MRFASFVAGAVACGALACVAPGAGQSNGAKMGEALAFAAVAGAAQVAQSAAEQQARNSAPVTHAGGSAVSPACDNQGQYACVTVAPGDGARPADPPEHDMSEDEARDYVLGYVNGVRKLNSAPPLARDEALDAFAQAGSEQLAQDHRVGRHIAEHATELRATSGEVQGSPDGSPPGALQEQLAEMLLRMTGEGPGGMHRDVLLRPAWRKLGVGIAHAGGRMFFTVDFTS